MRSRRAWRGRDLGALGARGRGEGVGEERQLPLQDIAQPARVALTGRKASPGLFEVMEVLGRERTLARLLAGAARAIAPA